MIINDMTSELVTAMRIWLDAHPKRSKKMLSKKCDVGYQTITDLIQGERNASLHTALKIIPEVMGHDEEFGFCHRYIHGFSKHVKRVGLTESNTANSADIKRAFRDETNFMIITLASSVGTTREEIRDLYNEIGVTKLNTLLNIGILKEINGRIKSDKEYFYHIDADTVLAIMHHFINLFDKNGIGKPGRLCHIHTDNISDSDVEKIHDKLKEAIEEVKVIAQESIGDNVFYTGLIMSILSGED